MNGELVPITVGQMTSSWAFTEDEIDPMTEFGRRSDPLLMGSYGGEVLCFVGFIPLTILSDYAYLWMYSTPAVERHRLIVGRWAHRLITEQQRYRWLIGHGTLYSRAWLRSLGAEVDGGSFKIGPLHA